MGFKGEAPPDLQKEGYLLYSFLTLQKRLRQPRCCCHQSCREPPFHLHMPSPHNPTPRPVCFQIPAVHTAKPPSQAAIRAVLGPWDHCRAVPCCVQPRSHAPFPVHRDAHRAPRPGLLAACPAPRVAGWGGKMFGAPAAIQLPMVVFEELPYRPFVKALASPP